MLNLNDLDFKFAALVAIFLFALKAVNLAAFDFYGFWVRCFIVNLSSS